MLTENYHKIANYLTEHVGANFIFLSILLTTAASFIYFIVISYIITQMDKRYFIQKSIKGKNNAAIVVGQNFHSKANITSLNHVLNLVKIIAGIFLLICGIVMLVLPGQGLLTILLGLSLIPFPGKHKLEQNLLARKSIRASLNWIRTKANKEPFIFD